MITIIGAGICGLFIGYLCKSKNIPFEILEKNDYTGGRIYTDYTSYHTPVELGASIFHSNQKILLFLLDRFEIEYEKVKTGKTQMDIPCKKISYPKFADEKVIDVINDICNPGMDEIAQMNYNTWQKSKQEEGDILICKNGLEQLTDKLAELLQDNIYFFHNVTKVGKDYIIVNNKKSKFDKLFVCCSLLHAKQFMKVPDVVQTIPSLRLYVEFKENHNLDYKYRVSDKLFRWAIVIDEKLLLASYLDGERAKNVGEMGEERAKKIIFKELGIKEKDVKKTWFMYWEQGIEVVKWDKDVSGMEELHNNVFQTFIPDIERNGQDQGWIEAHLRTAFACFKKI